MGRRTSWLGDALAGAIAGGVATWVMDKVTTGLMQGQSEATTEQEQAARPNGRSSVGNLVARVDDALELRLDDGARTTASNVVHYLLGIVPGAVYAVLRRRIPWLGAGQGLAYATALWAGNDEWLNSTLGLSGPFTAYPLATHWRGFVGHAVLGITTDAGISLLRR